VFDVEAALVVLSGRAEIAPAVDGVPPVELARSPAAARVGALAARDGLFLFHYEHRVRLALPDAWIAVGQPDAPSDWRDGVLPEPKYQSFRHDLQIGSFNPGHRAKWSAHELCHALVGTAWRPGAPPLFHATAARLAEIVPVVLWYWLDEVGLRRCDRHDGPLFRAFCPDCEAAAALGSVPPRSDAALRAAATYLDRELAAVARTRRTGRPVPHIHGSLDLCTDGVSYAAAHGPRLSSEATALWMERFAGPEVAPDLDGLEARVVAVVQALTTGSPLSPWSPDPAAGRDRWVAGDVGARLLQVRAQTEGDAAAGLLGLTDAIAAGGAPAAAFAGYIALHDAFVLPHPEDVFAVGYRVDGLPGRSVAQVHAGLHTVTPLALELAEDAGVDLVSSFVAGDTPVRRPLGLRFADALGPGALGALARYEAALRAAGPDREAAALGAGSTGGERLAAGAIAAAFPFDPVDLAAAVDRGDAVGVASGDRVTVEPPPADDPHGLVVARDTAGDLVVADVPAEWIAAVQADPSVLPEDVRGALSALGLLVPAQWAL